VHVTLPSSLRRPWPWTQARSPRHLTQARRPYLLGGVPPLPPVTVPDPGHVDAVGWRGVVLGQAGALSTRSEHSYWLLLVPIRALALSQFTSSLEFSSLPSLPEPGLLLFGHRVSSRPAIDGTFRAGSRNLDFRPARFDDVTPAEFSRLARWSDFAENAVLSPGAVRGAGGLV